MKTNREFEHALVARVQAGDRAAFDQLVAPYQPKLLWAVLRIVRDPVEAEDILQDSLIRAYKAIGSFREDASFYTWIFRVSVNTALGYRQRLRFVSHTLDDVDETSDSITPEDILVGKQLANKLQAAFETLAPEIGQAITLHQVDGLSYQEIADTMRCPIGTVRSRISNARHALAARIDAPTHYA